MAEPTVLFCSSAVTDVPHPRCQKTVTLDCLSCNATWCGRSLGWYKVKSRTKNWYCFPCSVNKNYVDETTLERSLEHLCPKCKRRAEEDTAEWHEPVATPSASSSRPAPADAALRVPSHTDRIIDPIVHGYAVQALEEKLQDYPELAEAFLAGFSHTGPLDRVGGYVSRELKNGEDSLKLYQPPLSENLLAFMYGAGHTLYTKEKEKPKTLFLNGRAIPYIPPLQPQAARRNLRCAHDTCAWTPKVQLGTSGEVGGIIHHS